MAETMQDNLNGQLTILKSQLEELAISFGDILMRPSVRSYLPCSSSWTSSTVWMKVLGKRSSRSDYWQHPLVRCSLCLARHINGWHSDAGFSSLAKGVRLLITHVGSASGVFSKLGVVLGGLSGPVVAVVAVIGTLVAAFMNLWNTNEEFRTAITGIWNDIVPR